MDIIEIIKKRYSTKEFDPTREITSETMESIKELLRYPPSSTNIQPWHFIIAQSEEAKVRIAKATQDIFVFNERKVLDASAVVIFCSKVAADEFYLDHLSAVEEQDGRFATKELKEQNHAGRALFASMHKYDLKDQQHWLDKQLYLNLGCFLLGVAALGLDALPMEGCELTVLNREFGLVEKGFTASFLVALGYHTQSDFNAALSKSRLPLDEIVDVL
ncbi:MAG: oxygen-insensitive NAD(P)H nitroreductase [Rikenellaceae bacterium]